MNYPRITSLTLLIAIFTLAWMVPGGPVETRDFSHLPPLIAWSFNVFLTALVMVSLALVYFMHKRLRWAFQATTIAGLAFALVFLLDLAEIFPVSPDPMSDLLFTLEIAGLLFGLILMWLSVRSLQTCDNWQSHVALPGWVQVVLVLMLLFGAYVVYFATSATLQF
ncbi:hypothetical protein GCM10009092_38740 [Bowmanella denitrificans]|uniref:DUF8051 domain-containing protein n=1 Tax=Bowmanella denitrificans TaxID=366582 RepID=A0ABP3HKY6_9ALTE|nr:hypothetical protein [Bowmanella denitrificans]